MLFRTVLLCFALGERGGGLYFVLMYPVSCAPASHLLSLCLRRRRPGDKTHALITEAFNNRGKKEMFHGYVMSITERVKVDPCHQNG